MEDNQNDLYHHGILGQKWGVRRYQNKDGSLTSAGKKHVDRLKNEYTELTGKQMRRKTSSSGKDSGEGKPNHDVKKMPTSEMTDKQLQDAVNRLRNQEEYNRRMNPKSKGQKFVEDLVDVGLDVAKETAKKAGKAYLNKLIQEKTGLDMGVGKKKDKKNKNADDNDDDD